MKTHSFTFTSDSCGYTIYCDGKPLGGAHTLGTSKLASDGRRRDWRNVLKDAAMHRETAERVCAELTAGGGPAYMRDNIPPPFSSHVAEAMFAIGEDALRRTLGGGQ